MHEHLEVGANAGTIFSMPITVISVRGSVRHIRPLPSDSTHRERAGLGDAEVGAADRDLRGEELASQMGPGRHRQYPADHR